MFELEGGKDHLAMQANMSQVGYFFNQQDLHTHTHTRYFSAAHVVLDFVFIVVMYMIGCEVGLNFIFKNIQKFMKNFLIILDELELILVNLLNSLSDYKL